MIDHEAMINGWMRHPGPWRGRGRGPGRPWNGIVEDTPCLWITWVKRIARIRGAKVEEVKIEIGGKQLEITSVPLTFGPRHYFRCPMCYRRCEAVYFLGSYVGCRACLRLGYRSQCHEPGTPWVFYERLFFDRHLPVSGRYKGSEILASPSLAGALEKALRWKVDGLISELMERVGVSER